MRKLLALLALLMAILVPSMLGYVKKSKAAATESEARNSAYSYYQF